MVDDEPACKPFCNRKEHGEVINAALTKRDVSDEELIAFLQYTCVQCGSSKDGCGRSSLHMAASCGRTTVCKYLVCQKQARIDEKDAESGYTALHRSIFYGKIDTAVALIQLGANMKILDGNALTPLDHAVQDDFIPFDLSFDESCITHKIYVWGVNTNYTIGPNGAHDVPDLLDFTEPKKIWLEKYHSAILSDLGEVYTFGHGVGGRLGIGSETTVLEPTKLKFGPKKWPPYIIDCAIARDHCLFLQDAGKVWACGLNTHHVLGMVPPPSQVLEPKPIRQLSNIKGIACGRYHSVAWTENQLYTWGLNGGQLGHDTQLGSTIIAPKVVTCIATAHRKIISVAASTAATALATDTGDIYLLHQGACRTVATRFGGTLAVHVYGGRLTTDVDTKHEQLKIVVWTVEHNIYLWEESEPQLCCCTFTLNRLLTVRDLSLNANGLVFLTWDGEVFNGKFKTRRKKKSHCVSIEVERVPRIYGAKSVTCDREGLNFATFHVHTVDYVSVLPDMGQPTFRQDIARLPSLEVEPDLTFQIGDDLFPVHRYIFGSLSKTLLKLASSTDQPVVLHNIHPEMFKQICLYAYSGSCDLLKVGRVSEDIAAMKNPIKLLQDTANQLGVTGLAKDLNAFEILGCSLRRRKRRQYHQVKDAFFYNSTTLPEFFDVQITTSCGNIVQAHKCILCARCEFFRRTFQWQSSSNHISLPFPLIAIEKLLDFIYVDRIPFAHGDDVDLIVNVLVLADYVLLQRFVEICEWLLSRRMTPRNVVKLLTIADTFNGVQLKAACMQFICINLPLMLETRRLEMLDDELLTAITCNYSTWCAKMRERAIAPSSDATSDERIKAIYAHSPPIALNFGEIIKAERGVKMHRRRNRSHRVADVTATANLPLDTTTDALEFHRLDADTPMTPSRDVECVPSSSNHDPHEDVFKLTSPQEFPTLNSSPLSSSSPKTRLKSSKSIKIAKLSQKARKRLCSEHSELVVDATTSVAESPKNPWKMQFDGMSLQQSSTAFGAIVAEERKQRENLARIRNKLLDYIQMEDQAIEALEKFYNVDNDVYDEIVRVRRVDCGAQIATPLWVHK